MQYNSIECNKNSDCPYQYMCLIGYCNKMQFVLWFCLVGVPIIFVIILGVSVAGCVSCCKQRSMMLQMYEKLGKQADKINSCTQRLKYGIKEGNDISNMEHNVDGRRQMP